MLTLSTVLVYLTLLWFVWMLAKLVLPGIQGVTLYDAMFLACLIGMALFCRYIAQNGGL